MGLRLTKPNPFEAFIVFDDPDPYTYIKETGRVVTYGDTLSFNAELRQQYRDARKGEPLMLHGVPVTCVICEADFVTRDFGIKHVEHEHADQIAEANEQLQETAVSASSIPTAASNRSLIEQMKEWGWQHKKNKGDWEVWKSPDGTVTVDVRPATQHVGTSAKTIKEIIEATGVDADTFWIGVDDHPDQTETEKKRARTSGVSRRVLSVLKQHSNGHLDVKTITGMLKGELTEEQVQGACSYLVGKKLISSPLRGIYTFDSDDVEHKVGIDINVGAGQTDHPSQGPSQPLSAAPEPPVKDPTPIGADLPLTVPARKPPQPSAEDIDRTVDEDEINDVLDMLFPGGFKAKHLPAIDHWRNATKALIASIRAD